MDTTTPKLNNVAPNTDCVFKLTPDSATDFVADFAWIETVE
jgi:hypothetical protein